MHKRADAKASRADTHAEAGKADIDARASRADGEAKASRTDIEARARKANIDVVRLHDGEAKSAGHHFGTAFLYAEAAPAPDADTVAGVFF